MNRRSMEERTNGEQQTEGARERELKSDFESEFGQLICVDCFRIF